MSRPGPHFIPCVMCPVQVIWLSELAPTVCWPFLCIKADLIPMMTLGEKVLLVSPPTGEDTEVHCAKVW